MLAFSMPVKAVSLAFLPVWFFYSARKVRLRSRPLLFVSIFALVNLIVTIAQNGAPFVINYLLMLVFIAPVLLLSISAPGSTSIAIGRPSQQFKRALDHFLILQIVVSVVAMTVRFSSSSSFDLNFGDSVAGTFRDPFIYKADASNVMFVFTLILMLTIYITLFGLRRNLTLLAMTFLIVFFASVNHLILAAAVGYAVAYVWGRPRAAMTGISFMILGGMALSYLYSTFQPFNFLLIKERLYFLYSVLRAEQPLAAVGFKGQYLANFFADFASHPFEFMFTGSGAGSYSGRAALFMTGEYVDSFRTSYVSSMMAENTYPLWRQMVNGPPWLAGAFNYPYSSVTSFVAEIGLVPSLLLAFGFFRRLQLSGIFSGNTLVFLLSFLLLAGLVDNYYEYFQAFAIFAILLFSAENLQVAVHRELD